MALIHFYEKYSVLSSEKKIKCPYSCHSKNALPYSCHFFFFSVLLHFSPNYTTQHNTTQHNKQTNKNQTHFFTVLWLCFAEKFNAFNSHRDLPRDLGVFPFNLHKSAIEYQEKSKT